MATDPRETPLFPFLRPVRAERILTASARRVIDEAVARGAGRLFPLFSGGHDSLCAVTLASEHPRFDGRVYHIDTGIGAHVTRQFVEAVCADAGWSLQVYRSKATYERYVTRLGFPGPGTHQWVYNWLKDRCVSTMTRGAGIVGLITGCRSEESTRRMGHVQPVAVGETSRKTGRVRRRSRIWAAPCHDWSAAEQRQFMQQRDLPENPIKLSPLGMSGECFCGAFASPGELALIRRYAPDVALEIDRLAILAAAQETPCRWGERPDRAKGPIVAQTGPLCTSCDRKAAAAGLLFQEIL